MLNQPELISYFSRRIDDMRNSRLKKEELVTRVRAAARYPSDDQQGKRDSRGQRAKNQQDDERDGRRHHLAGRNKDVKRKALLFSLLAIVALPLAWASVDDALSFAHEAAVPYVKQGFTVREDAWGEISGSRTSKP